MKILLSMCLAVSFSAGAAVDPAPPPAAVSSAPQLGLAEYLQQVMRSNPQARADRDGIEVAELRLREADVPFSPELYADYNLFDNKAQPPNAFMASRTQGRNWDVGVRTDTLMGLHADAYFTSLNNRLGGLSPLVPAVTSYEQPQLGLKLTQSLWRNGFGRAAREKVEADRAGSRKTLLDAKFRLKNLLLNAENTYWSLVSFTEIIRLQRENVDRARRLRDYMKQKVNQRLMDDVDYLQAEVNYQSRELEYKSSLDDQAVLGRYFNTLRGAEGDVTEPLLELPKGDLLMRTVRDPSKRMSREDFRAVFEMAKMNEGYALSSESYIAPKLDLVAGISSNPIDGKTSTAYGEALQGKYPNWNVGVTFSIPLDWRLIGNMRRSYRAARSLAKNQIEQADYEERRAWDDLLKQNLESQERYGKAASIESISNELVRRERQRLLDGRSTTFQTINFETSLASAQIARTRAQLDLVQKHNLIKQFVEMK